MHRDRSRTTTTQRKHAARATMLYTRSDERRDGRIEAHRERLSRAAAGCSVTTSDAIRNLLDRALDEAEATT